MLTKYFKRIGLKRFLVMMVGNIFLGMGISVFKFSGMGNDPFSGMVMALADCVKIEYANFLVIVNLCIFLVELLLGREFIGVGTIVNAFILGYIVTFFYNILMTCFPSPEQLAMRVIIVLIGVVVASFGISLYQTPNVGTAPYDSLSLMASKHFPKIPYFWYRIATDGICALICFGAGGIIGLGTLATAFGFGPVIDFFNVHFTRKLFKKDEDILR